MRIFAISAFAVALAACESTVPHDAQLRLAPPERVYKGTPITSPTPARVAFVRDAGGGHLRNWRISIDDTPVASLDSAEYVIVEIDPGQHQFKAELDVTTPAVKDFVERIEVTIAPGASQVFRIGNTFEAKLQFYRDPSAKLPAPTR